MQEFEKKKQPNDLRPSWFIVRFEINQSRTGPCGAPVEAAPAKVVSAVTEEG